MSVTEYAKQMGVTAAHCYGGKGGAKYVVSAARGYHFGPFADQFQFLNAARDARDVIKWVATLPQYCETCETHKFGSPERGQS